MQMKPPKDSLEFIKLLNVNNVRYVIVGGYAVAWHGYPRFTGDLDFFVERTPDNATALAQAVEQFGFASLGLSAKDFLEEGVVVQLGRPPYRIDILNFADGLDFARVWQNHIQTEWDGVPVNMISKPELINNKISLALRDQFWRHIAWEQSHQSRRVEARQVFPGRSPGSPSRNHSIDFTEANEGNEELTGFCERPVRWWFRITAG